MDITNQIRQFVYIQPNFRPDFSYRSIFAKSQPFISLSKNIPPPSQNMPFNPNFTQSFTEEFSSSPHEEIGKLEEIVSQQSPIETLPQSFYDTYEEAINKLKVWFGKI